MVNQWLIMVNQWLVHQFGHNSSRLGYPKIFEWDISGI